MSFLSIIIRSLATALMGLVASCGANYDYPATSLPIVSVSVVATYATGPTFNVHNNLMEFGNSPTTDCSTTISSCIHFGEKRSVEIPSESSCSGLSLNTYDENGSLNNFFDWTCSLQEGRGVVFKSSGFATGKGIENLINWDASPLRFKQFKVQISASESLYVSDLSTWWSTEIVETGFPAIITTTEPLSNAGKINAMLSSPVVTFSSASSSSPVVTLNQDRQAFIMQEGNQISSSTNNLGLNIEAEHVWFEGKIVLTKPAATGISLALVAHNFFTMRNSNIEGSTAGASYGLKAIDFGKIHIENSTLQVGSFGLYLERSDGGIFRSVTAISSRAQETVSIRGSSENNFEDLSVYSKTITTYKPGLVISGTLATDNIAEVPSNSNIFKNVTLRTYSGTQIVIGDGARENPQANRFTNLNLYATKPVGGVIGATYDILAGDVPTSTSEMNLFVGGNSDLWTLTSSTSAEKSTPPSGFCADLNQGYTGTIKLTTGGLEEFACLK